MASIVVIKLLIDFLIIAVIYTQKRYVALSTMICGIIQNVTWLQTGVY